MTIQRRLISYYLPVLLWCGVIFYLSSQQTLPGPSVAELDFIFKKLAHMGVYAVLYVLLFRAVNLGFAKKNFIPVFALTLLYAISDEIHQGLTPGRSPTMRDILYDSFGMTIAMLKLKGII